MSTIKSHSTKIYFSRLQLRSKKWFTAVYFLQILTKPRRTPLIRGHLSLNASWFSYEQTQKKYNFLEKLIRKKIQKNFIVNNNNKIIRAWYLSSKWLVCRSIVNQTTEERAEQNWVPCLKQISLNIVPCFAIKWLKYTCNKGILSIANAFLSFFGAFSLESKIIDLLFFLFCLTK